MGVVSQSAKADRASLGRESRASGSLPGKSRLGWAWLSLAGPIAVLFPCSELQRPFRCSWCLQFHSEA